MTELPTVAALVAWTSQRQPDRSATTARVTRLIKACVPRNYQSETLKIAGTNGKGSVCAMLEAHLLATGKRVGVFTSPHLQRITERIRINGLNIPHPLLEHHAREIQPTLLSVANERGPLFVPSFFEVLLLIALRIFHDENIECAVLESGIGGTHDATGVIPAHISAVTSIALDHEAKIGPSLAEIAREKAGIATQGSTLVLGPSIRAELAHEVCQATAARKVCVTQAPGLSMPPSDPMCPTFQQDNLATTRAILDARGDPPGDVSFLTIPGRFEYIEGSPDWLLDGAHNAEAISALIHGIEQRFASRERILIYGASKEKSYTRYIARLPEIANETYVVDGFPNAAARRDVAGAMSNHVAAAPWNSTLSEFVRFVRRRRRRALVIVTGSMFLVGAIRTLLINMATPNPTR